MPGWRQPTTLVSLDVAIEAATGVCLVVAPGLVATLLIAAGLDVSGAFAARVAGIALIALCLGCWTVRRGPGLRGALVGLLAYNLLTAAYLALVGLAGARVGVLLWPAVAFHAMVALLLAAAWPEIRE